MNDWSENKEEAVTRVGGEAVKKRFIRFLIELQSTCSSRLYLI